jgi:DNA-binding CsgD family transcriptional regulator
MIMGATMTPLTSFVGRESELESLAGALSAARLVTVAGPGGCGKTRLAVEVATRQRAGWPDGVHWVDLAATGDPVVVPELVAAALGVVLATDRGDGEGYDAAWTDGHALDLRDAIEYARRARGRRGRPSTGWASLTPTERSVVRLAADGLSNPDIGARLFMSRATVKAHLSHVYAKLGVSNRTELATVAGPHLADGR